MEYEIANAFVPGDRVRVRRDIIGHDEGGVLLAAGSRGRVIRHACRTSAGIRYLCRFGDPSCHFLLAAHQLELVGEAHGDEGGIDEV